MCTDDRYYRLARLHAAAVFQVGGAGVAQAVHAAQRLSDDEYAELMLMKGATLARQEGVRVREILLAAELQPNL